MRTTIAEAAYLAGLIDGEGCITVMFKPYRGILGIGAKLVIANTYKPVLEWVRNLVGVGQLVAANDSGRLNTCWRYVLSNNARLLELLQLVASYMIVKKAHTELMLSFLSSRIRRQKRAAYIREEIRWLFQLRLLNQKVDHRRLHYAGNVYSWKQFEKLALGGRTHGVYRVVEWTQKMDALLGTDSDQKIADGLDVKLAAVQRRRFQLKIRPAKATRWKREHYQSR